MIPMRCTVLTCIRDQRLSFFQECAASIVAQETALDWIVVDDGSRATNRALYAEVLSRLPGRITVTPVWLHESVGLAAARNAGLANATGDWLLVLDSDDRLGVNLMQRLSEVPYRAQVVAVEALYFDSQIQERRPLDPFANLWRSHRRTGLDPFLWWDFYYHGIIARPRLLRHIGGYADRLRYGEDQDILLRATEPLAGDELHFIHEVGYAYRRNPDGVCARHWDAVHENYTQTMVSGANRRGAPFVDCRLAGVTVVADVEIDTYEYALPTGAWVTWEAWAQSQSTQNKDQPVFS